MDHDGDVTLPGFFGTQHAAIVPSHDWKHVPLGKAVIREVANEAVVDFKLNLKIEPARQWHEAIRFDLENPPALQEYSYGFSIARGGSRPGEVNGRPVRFLQPLKSGAPGVRVHEVSPVLRGAGIGSRTLGLTSLSASDDDDSKQLVNEYLRFVAISAGINQPDRSLRVIRDRNARALRQHR
ncbi:MAG TPA: hypothetical protein VIR30_02730 [Nocardioides sp.]